jgi:hypothetical protein
MKVKITDNGVAAIWIRSQRAPASIRVTANAPWELVYNRGRMIRKTRV